MANVGVNTKCIICLDGVSLSEVSALPCGHTFHYHCILFYVEHGCTMRADGVIVAQASCSFLWFLGFHAKELTWSCCPLCGSQANIGGLVTRLFFNFDKVSQNPPRSLMDEELIATLQADLYRTEADRASLIDELFVARQEAEHAKMEIFNLKSSLFLERRKHLETRDIFLDANSKVVEARNQIGYLHAELFRMQGELSKVVAELSQSEAQVETLRTQVANLEETAISATKADLKAVQETEATPAKVTEHEANATNLRTQSDSVDLDGDSSDAGKNCEKQQWFAQKRFLNYDRHVSISNGKVTQSKGRS